MTTDDKQALGHWINGEHCTSARGATFTVFNPSDDSPFALVAEGSAVEMDLAVQAAHDAFQTYRHTSVNDRERWLATAAALLEERKAEFVDLLIDEAGSTISKAQFETGKAVSFIRAAIGMVRQVSGKQLQYATQNELDELLAIQKSAQEATERAISYYRSRDRS